MSGFVPVEELEVYQLSEKLADLIWEQVITWDNFARDTLGKQLVRAADSIGANIAEGGGSDGARENHRYLGYAQRSLRETRFHLRRAFSRSLLDNAAIELIRDNLDILAPKLTSYRKGVRRRLME
jgi:four helix bundle protein